MALADALADATRKPGPTCTFGRVIATLNDDDRAALAHYDALPDTTAAMIVRALAAEGHRVNRGPVERHRRGDCACGTR